MTTAKAPIRFGILTISDRAASGEREDASGPALCLAVVAYGWQVVHQGLLPDDLLHIRDILVTWSDSGDIDILLTTGGTGFARRDVTPEATQAAIERPAPGLVEAMRAASLAITPHAMLSRGVAGIRQRTLIINLPGSPQAAIENLAVIQPVLEHAVQLLREDPAAEADHRRVSG